MDFGNARSLSIEGDENGVAGQHCKITQYADSALSVRDVIHAIWFPQPGIDFGTNFMGPMCMVDENDPDKWYDVLAFSSTDAEGIPWQAFFDMKTRKIKKSYSGLASLLPPEDVTD